jgi:hypothetical protein
MRGHITSEELHLASEGAIEPDSLLEISQHLDTCADCARRAEGLVDLDALAGTLRDALSVDGHPGMPELTAYADDELEGSAREWVDAHLEGCIRCREDLSDLRSEQQSLASGSGWRKWQWIAAGILIAGAIGAGTMWLQSGSRAPASPPAAGIRPPHHDVPAPPHDAWSDLERSVLAAGKIDPPPILHTLRPAAQTLRGNETAVGAELHPAGEVIDDDRPRLTWTATPGARYIVMIFAGEEPVATSGPLSDAQWRPPQALRRGTTYSWQVETKAADGTSTIAPTPPQPEALLRIADAETLADIEAAGLSHPADHLLLAILYARAGMKTRALAELDSHLMSHPSDAGASALADGIRRW